MTKYSKEFKLDAVLGVIEQGKTGKEMARMFGINASQLRRWVYLYNAHGVEGLIIKSGSYTGDFKLNAIEYMHSYNLSVREAAAHLGIPSDSTLGNWERIYYEEGSEALFRDTRGRPGKMSKDKIAKPKMPKLIEKDLITEVQRIRMENEYLKKLNALVQEREKSAKKTK